jgi:serine/threonine-protein kinase
MAPEQARGDAVDERADLYALGVVAYEALAGAHPFAARSLGALISAHMSETPPPLATRRPDVPPALAALVTGLLAKDPAERPPSAEAVLRVLEGAAASPTRGVAGRRRAALASVAVIATLGAAGYAVWRRAGAPDPASAPAAPVIRSVAVLPFDNAGGGRQDDFFSDGLTDELAHALARVPGLRVAGRTSSYAFKGKAVAAAEVARVLGVDAFVSATVRRSGDRLRVSPQLVRTADGTVVWDSVYESRSGDVFAVQDSLTRALVAALTPALGSRGGIRGAPRAPPPATGGRGTTDAEAYDLYLKGRYYWLERGRDNVTRAIAYFRQAVARDPAFARAHAGLAMAYSVLPVYVPDPSDSTTALLTASATRALALDSTLADAQLSLALAYYRALQFREAEARYRAALAVDPSNVSAHQGLGLLLLTLGRNDEGLVEERHAEQLDPLAKSVVTAHALALLFERRFAEAAAVERRAFALDSTFPLAFWGMGVAQTLGGQPDSAVRTLERGIRLRPETPGQYSALLLAYAAAGRWSDAERFREQLRRPGGDPSGGVVAGFADLVFGDREPLVRLLTTAAGQRAWLDSEGGFGCHPLLDPLWADERFRAAMRGRGVEACPLARPWPVPPRG